MAENTRFMATITALLLLSLIGIANFAVAAAWV
jgi:hypothetical protein